MIKTYVHTSEGKLVPEKITVRVRFHSVNAGREIWATELDMPLPRGIHPGCIMVHVDGEEKPRAVHRDHIKERKLVS